MQWCLHLTRTGMNDYKKCLNAAGVTVALILAEKYDLPAGKVIELLTEFMNILDPSENVV